MKTTPQEESVFEAARHLEDPVMRRTFLDCACGGDPALRTRVESLLESVPGVEQFFQSASRLVAGIGLSESGLVNDLNLPAPVFNADEPLGARIGNYKLLQKIGEGGCGIVYMAEQEKPLRRRVAIKIIKLGMDTKNVIARFESERQALAMMDHPNIARVLDAGATEAGRPYFVMELVRGVKITDYCNENQLDTRLRLDLFIQICQAIQHAHQKGIIHRDIKPSNILVTLHDGVPVPKVIDFGIAKATEVRLTELTVFTAYEQMIGTPAYMSPEQAEMSGLDVDTRSDIYSLGVLLYELLTGRTPFDPKQLVQDGLDAMRRTLREREPQRPSTMVTTLRGEELAAVTRQRSAELPALISSLRGDLDWIVMKALEKDRRRRYETANSLAMDIQRYLNNEPVIARPPSRLYRLQKLVRRNRGVFAAGAAVTLALVMGLSLSTWLFFRERAARERAVAAEQQQAQLRREAELERANEAALRLKAETREKISLADVRLHQGNFDTANELLASITGPQPSLETAEVFRNVGEWLALQGRGPEATARFALLLQVNTFDDMDMASLDYLRQGPLLVELGRRADYETFRQSVVARFVGTTNAVTAERTIKISLLLPSTGPIPVPLADLAETARNKFSQVATTNGNAEEIFQAAWGSLSLGLLEYRRGNDAEAMHWASRCLAYPGDNPPRIATAHIIMAMAAFQAGQHDLASSELALGQTAVQNEFDQGVEIGGAAEGFWFDWYFARILLREAKTAIGDHSNL